MRGLIPFSAILVVFALLPMAVPAQPTVTIYTDADTYHLGDTIEVSLSADNPGAGVSVDAYIGLLAPDGAVYTLGPAGWSGNIEAWISNIYVPSGFSFGPAALWSFDVPCLMPPIGADGDYNFAALLTRPGTFEWLSGLSLAPFTVSVASLEYYVSANLGSDGNDGSEARPWRTITHALASVTGTPGSPVTIHVLPGRYGPSTNGETFPLVMKSWVSLLGEDRDTTILDGENAAYHVILCDGVANLTIEGLTITGGNANGPEEADKSGGGIFCYGSSPTITDNTITGNSANLDGGGIYCFWGSSPRIDNNTITGNIVGSVGGGICCYANSSPTITKNTITGNSAHRAGGIECSWYSSPTITDNTITGNHANQDGGGVACWINSSARITGNTITGNSVNWRGGGIYCFSSSPEMTDNTITDNSANRGGGIACEDSSPTITGNTITGNIVGSVGGGIYCYDNSSPAMRGNTITDNSAGSVGGGIACYYSSPTITGNRITGNSAKACGGGISCHYSSPAITDNAITANAAGWAGGIYCDNSSPTITNNAITANSASSVGGGIYCYENSSPTIENCTIANNYGDGGVFRDPLSLASPTITDSIIWGNGDDLVNCSASYCCIEDDDGGEGIIHDDPMFVSGPLGNFYLHPLSPCIDAGSRTAEEAGLSNRTTQADGTPDTGIVDMGYHYPLP